MRYAPLAARLIETFTLNFLPISGVLAMKAEAEGQQRNYARAARIQDS